MGKIATWTNKNIFRDIGTIDSLIKAQSDNKPVLTWNNKDNWSIEFKNNVVKNFNL